MVAWCPLLPPTDILPSLSDVLTAVTRRPLSCGSRSVYFWCRPIVILEAESSGLEIRDPF